MIRARTRAEPCALIAAFGLLASCASAAQAQPIANDDIPPALRPWVRWVVENDDSYGCTPNGDGVICTWPGSVRLDVRGGTGAFTQDLTADRRILVRVPGDSRHWPLDVRVDGQPTPVIDQADLPTIEVARGSHVVTGTFRFATPPESIAVAPDVARVDLFFNGQAVLHPRRQEDGSVWIREAGAAAGPDAGDVPEQDALSLEVFRHVRDGLPLVITTLITVHASGRTREVDLGRVLLAGSVPAAVSSDVPVQLSREGELRFQLRPGTYAIRIEAARRDPNAALLRPASAAPWPEQEIWVWQPDESLRQVELRGPASIDPHRTSLPEEWRALAAFVLASDSRIELGVLRRGEPEPPPNQISVTREMRLELDGSGYTIRDQLSAHLTRDHRLDLLSGELGRVSASGQDLLITKRPGQATGRGVELRERSVSLTADWRYSDSIYDVPAVGWSHDVTSLRTVLHLPPGWTVFAAAGADRAPGTWLSRWDVGPVFFVLLIAVIFWRLFGWKEGLLALATMILVYDEPKAPEFVWLFVLVPIAILRALQHGYAAIGLWLAWAAAFLVLIGLFIPFATEQIRFARYPQLRPVSYGAELSSVDTRGEDDHGWMADQDEAATVPLAPPPGDMPSGGEGVAGRSRALRSAEDLLGGLSSSGDDTGGRGPAGYQQYDASTVVQTGPGVASWQHTIYSLEWTSPVRKDHRTTIFLIPPWLSSLLAVLRVLGIAAMILVVLRKRPGFPKRRKDEKPSPEPASAALAAAAVVVLALGLGLPAAAQPAPRPAESGAIPTPDVLEDLRARLNRPPACAPSCVSVSDADVTATGDRLVISMTAHAAARGALVLPGPASQWVPLTISVDGQPSRALRNEDDYVLLRLEAGVHRVVLESTLAGRAQLALSFRSTPRVLRASGTGWDIDGINEDGVLEGSLQLRRRYEAAAPGATGPERATVSVDIPVWVALTRRIEIGPRWTVASSIRRISSSGAPVVLRIPLLEGESVTQAGVTVEGREVLVSVGDGVQDVSWSSVLTPSERIVMRTSEPTDRDPVVRSDTWQVLCGPIWSCRFDGVVPVHHDENGVWGPSFRPYAGETLTVQLSRPAPADGQALTIDSASLVVMPSFRSTRSTLNLAVRASVGRTLRITLPAGAEIQTLRVAGEDRPVQRRGEHLEIGLAPGSSAIQLEIDEPVGLSSVLRSPAISVDGGAVDVTIDMRLPDDRWLLWTHGPSWGPAVLFWPYLVLILLVAVALGRTPWSPLKTHHWLLLGLGLTQIPAPLAMIVVGWFFAATFQHRRVLHGIPFNLAQLSLIGYTLVAFGVLVAAVWMGLTVQPDMQVDGDQSTNNSLHWYVDRIAEALPSVAVINVTIWVWKGLMLLWAGWLAVSIVRWSKWLVGPFREKGFFAPLPKAKPRTPPAAPPPAPPATPPTAG